EAAIRLGTFLEDQPFHIETPLMDLDKATSVRVAMAIPGCYGALGWSHTAYDGAYPPTGKDHASLLRAKGFELAEIPDPLVVRAVWEDTMALPDAPNYRMHMSLISKYKPKTAAELDWATPLDQNPYYIEFIHDRLEMLAKELVR
ncbi:MAG TPA: 7-cyano-7-deazaguanine synthase, partial [Rhizorhapis sp.]|nr:7-cyano-7-deazaguanine synthase [Rhizorhapis sp.]